MHHPIEVRTGSLSGVLLGFLLSWAVLATPALSQEKSSGVGSTPGKGLPAIGAPAAGVTEINAAMLKRDQEYRDLFEKMDKEHNKIARALKEYTDPKTSIDKKKKLRTYLRQTPIDDPEDKKLLKGAALDPKYEPLLSDIELALLHAIQGHPEESDKEFLLDLLRKKIPPGWLMYAMLEVWDDRYVPFLLDYARRGSDLTIEILGRQKVMAAVPVLEQVLKDESINSTVRGDAMKSLWLITGKRYEIGK